MKVEVLPIPGPRSAEARAFLELPYNLYDSCPQWVPPLRAGIRALLERRHPFFEHSPGEFFITRRGAATAGRVLALENTRYNARHGRRFAWFYLFECAQDAEAAGALLEQAGYSPFKHYYSARLQRDSFRMPVRVRALAEKVLARGRFLVRELRSRRELLAVAPRLGQMYNTAIAASHPDSYPYTEAELDLVIRQFAQVAEPGLIKVIACDGEPIGFVFGFPDLSAALQRARGRLSPRNLLDLAAEYRRHHLADAGRHADPGRRGVQDPSALQARPLMWYLSGRRPTWRTRATGRTSFA